MRPIKWRRARLICLWLYKGYLEAHSPEGKKKRREFWFGVFQQLIATGIIALISALVSHFKTR